MRYLIIGGTGLVGKNLRKLLGTEDVFFTSRGKVDSPNALICDILDEQDLKKVFEISKPEVVINAANLAGGVDFCENNPDLAKKFHFDAVVNMCKLCKDYGSKFVFISSDYVFDGTKCPYKEDGTPNPLNKYGYFKLQSENWIRENLPDALIVRTTNVYGWDPDTKTPNYLMGVYFKLQKHEEIKAPSYLCGNPTHAMNLSAAILELCSKNEKGVFHVVGKSFIDRYSWTLKFIEKLGIKDPKINEVKDTPQMIVPRPLLSNLNTSKFTQNHSTYLMDMDEGLRLFCEEMSGIPI